MHQNGTKPLGSLLSAHKLGALFVAPIPWDTIRGLSSPSVGCVMHLGTHTGVSRVKVNMPNPQATKPTWTSSAGPQRRQASKVNAVLIPAMCTDHTAYTGNPWGQRHTVIELRHGLLLNPSSTQFLICLLFFVLFYCISELHCIISTPLVFTCIPLLAFI